MKRIQIFATILPLLFLALSVVLSGTASAADEKKSNTSILPAPQKPVLPPAPKEPKFDPCSISSAGKYKLQPNEPQEKADVPSLPNKLEWTNYNLPTVPAKGDKKSPSGGLPSTLRTSPWWNLKEVVKDINAAAREKDGVTKSKKSSLRSRLRAVWPRVTALIRTINTNENDFVTKLALNERGRIQLEVAQVANKEGANVVEKANQSLERVWSQYWGESGEIWDLVNAANTEIGNLDSDRNKAEGNLGKERVTHCENVNTIKKDEYEDLVAAWTEGSDAVDSSYVDAVNSIATISRKLATEKSLETELAREDIENINLETDAAIVEIVERYEATKVEEVSAAQSEIAEITLTAQDEVREETSAAAVSIKDINTELAAEISDFESLANEEKVTFREERDDALTDLALESRDSKSAVGENRKAALAGIKARARAKINTYREKIDGAKKVLDRRPRANWPRAVRNQLLRAQRKAENVYANNIQALRNTKAQRDTQLAQKKATFAKRVAAIKKREEAQRIAIERKYRKETAPIDKKLAADKAAAQGRAQEEIKTITNDRDEKIRVIKERQETAVRNITQTLSDEILRLDRQKNGEASKEDRARTVAIGQRDRAKVRKIAEFESEAQDESVVIIADYKKETKLVVNTINSNKRDTERAAGQDIKEENRRFSVEEGDLREIIEEANREIKDVRLELSKENRALRREYNEDLKDTEDEGKEAVDDVKKNYDDGMKKADKEWGPSRGTKTKAERNKVKKLTRDNKRDANKEKSEGYRSLGKVDIKKK